MGGVLPHLPPGSGGGFLVVPMQAARSRVELSRA